MEPLLLQGDCLKLMPAIPENSIDMILCDLPYGVTANRWDSMIPLAPLWTEYLRLIKKNGAIVLFGQGMFTAKLMTSKPNLWRYNLIWQKTQPTGFLNARRMPLRCHEDVLVFYQNLPEFHPQKTTGHPRKVSTEAHKKRCVRTSNYGKYSPVSYDSSERYPRSVLTFPKDVQKFALHPTQKPVALLEFLIKSYTNLGDTVLDNCMGSGSTGIACLNTGRRFIGMELDGTYFQCAVERIKNCKGESHG